MHLAMIGVDYKHASIAYREKLYFSQNKLEMTLNHISENCEYKAVIISTCNRTEIYFSCDEKMSDSAIISEFLSLTGLKHSDFEKICYIHRENELVKYLFQLACGLQSMILGEDQVISQVNDAAEKARECRATDAVLNTLFKHAVTCAKIAKTKVNINFVSPSIVSEAVLILKSNMSCLKGKNVLVIGNGEMGKLAANLLLNEGCNVNMTLRHYKHTAATVPKHCKSVLYEDRMQYLKWADIVISATKSPHFTLTYEMIKNEQNLPEYIFDMALPRDIEPEIVEKGIVKYYGVDDIGKSVDIYDMKELERIKEIISAQTIKYFEWISYRKMLLPKGVLA